jgi:hypothetical protein
LFFAAFGLGIERIGILKAIYPMVWGVLQTVTGPLSDRWGRKGLIVAGMWVQAAALFLTASIRGFGWWFVASVLLGIGTAMVYPTLIASVSDASHPSWRARSLSVYRFWRDLGYAIGVSGNHNRPARRRYSHRSHRHAHFRLGCHGRRHHGRASAIECCAVCIRNSPAVDNRSWWFARWIGVRAKAATEPMAGSLTDVGVLRGGTDAWHRDGLSLEI